MEDASLDYARRKVSGPATALIVTCVIYIAFLLFGLAFSVWLLLSGTASEMRQPLGMSKETQVMIRIVSNILSQATNVVVLVGALRMKGLRSYGLSKLACILALVPCIGPCVVVGIPFGIWGLVVLNDPSVRSAFKT